MSKVLNNDCMIEIIKRCDIKTKHIFGKIVSKKITKIISDDILKYNIDDLATIISNNNNVIFNFTKISIVAIFERIQSNEAKKKEIQKIIRLCKYENNFLDYLVCNFEKYYSLTETTLETKQLLGSIENFVSLLR